MTSFQEKTNEISPLMLPWTTLCCKANHHGHLMLVRIFNHFRRSPHLWLFQMQLTSLNDLVNRLLPYPDYLSSPHNNPVSECTHKGAQPCALTNDHNLMCVWFPYCSAELTPKPGLSPDIDILCSPNNKHSLPACSSDRSRFIRYSIGVGRAG